MITLEDFEKRMYEECLDELYKASQPSISYKELIEKCKKEPLVHHYQMHYLASEDAKSIVDKYISMYRLDSKFKDHCELVIDNMVKGCSKDKYIPADGNTPGHRSYEKVPPLSEEIGEANLNKVVEFIKGRVDFYRFDLKLEQFVFNMMNYAPDSNKEAVIERWKEQGKEIEIVDRDPEYNYERYWLGLSEDAIEEYK